MGAYKDDIRLILPLLAAGMDPNQGLDMFMQAQGAQDSRQAEKEANQAAIMQQVIGQYGGEGVTAPGLVDQTEALMNSAGFKPGGGRWDETLAGLTPIYSGQAEMGQMALIDSPDDLAAIDEDLQALMATDPTDRSGARTSLHGRYEAMATALGIPYTPRERETVDRMVDAVFGGQSSFYGEQPAAGEEAGAAAEEAPGDSMAFDTPLPDFLDSIANNISFGGLGKLTNAENTGDIFEGLGQTGLAAGVAALTLGAGSAAAGAGAEVAGEAGAIAGRGMLGNLVTKIPGLGGLAESVGGNALARQAIARPVLNQALRSGYLGNAIMGPTGAALGGGLGAFKGLGGMAGMKGGLEGLKAKFAQVPGTPGAPTGMGATGLVPQMEIPGSAGTPGGISVPPAPMAPPTMPQPAMAPSAMPQPAMAGGGLDAMTSTLTNTGAINQPAAASGVGVSNISELISPVHQQVQSQLAGGGGIGMTPELANIIGGLSPEELQAVRYAYPNYFFGYSGA